jgi:hypothetical protein
MRILRQLVGVTRVDNVQNENTQQKPTEDSLIHEISKCNGCQKTVYPEQEWNTDPETLGTKKLGKA